MKVIEGKLVAFGDYLKSLNRSQKTIAAYQSDLKSFFAFAAGKNVDKKTIYGYIKKLAKKNKPTTINRKVMAVKQYWQFLIDRGDEVKNPVTNIRLPKPQERVPRHLTYGEVQVIFENLEKDNSYAGIRDRAILELLYYGPRHSVIKGLTLKQLDLAEKQITVVEKGNRTVVYPFGERCAIAIRNYLKIRNAGAGVREVFTIYGRPLSSKKLIEIVKKRCAVVKKGVTPHQWRHTAAFHILDRTGGNIKLVQEMLHHKNIATTQIYLDMDTEYVKKQLDAFHPRG